MGSWIDTWFKAQGCCSLTNFRWIGYLMCLTSMGFTIWFCATNGESEAARIVALSVGGLGVIPDMVSLAYMYTHPKKTISNRLYANGSNEKAIQLETEWYGMILLLIFFGGGLLLSMFADRITGLVFMGVSFLLFSFDFQGGIAVACALERSPNTPMYYGLGNDKDDGPRLRRLLNRDQCTVSSMYQEPVLLHNLMQKIE